MSQACVRVRVASAAFVLLLIAFPAPALAQQAKVSFRIAPFGVPNLSPLFKVDVVEAVGSGGLIFPSFTLTDTNNGPQVTNLALLLPDVTIGTTAVASRLGDQPSAEHICFVAALRRVGEEADAGVELLDRRRDPVDIRCRSAEYRVRRAGAFVGCSVGGRACASASHPNGVCRSRRGCSFPSAPATRGRRASGRRFGRK